MASYRREWGILVQSGVLKMTQNREARADTTVRKVGARKPRPANSYLPPVASSFSRRRLLATTFPYGRAAHFLTRAAASITLSSSRVEV